MKTRRKSKITPAASQEEAEPPAAGSSAPFTVTIPDDLDLDYLSSLLPEVVDLTNPSPETISSLYRLLVGQAADAETSQRELEEAQAEIQRKDVELDQALQDRETATSELQSTTEAVQKELEQVKQEKETLATERAKLQAQLDAVSTTQTSSSAEVQTLKQRVEETEREKRDLMGVVSRLQDDAAQRENEIQALRADLRQARQDHQALERNLRELTSSETSTKFKLESLTQQLELAKTEAERTSAELVAKSEEFAKYRKTKHVELAELQAAHDSITQAHASTESSHKALQSAHTTQTHQLTEALTRIQTLKGQLAEQEATYSSEAAGLRRLVSMMEEREKQAKVIVDSIEKDYEGVTDKAERREAVLREEIESQKQRAEDAEKRVEDLQAVLDRMDRGEFPIPAFAGSISNPGTPARGMSASTPARNGSPSADLLTSGMLGLSPTVAMASRAQRGGKSFTEVYSDYIKLQEEFSRKCAEYDHMDRTLSAVLAQIEERAPILTQQRAEYERLQAESTQLASQLSQTLSERDALATAAEENGQKLQKSLRENELLEKQLGDLSRQLRTLLKELGRHQDPSLPSDEELEHDAMSRPAENIEAVITNNLVLFRSIPQLQEQNQKLLKIVRELGSKLESEEKEYKEALEREQGEAVREAHEAIKQLQSQLESQKRSSEVTVQAYMKERDSLRTLLQRQQESGSGTRMLNGINGQSQTSEPSELAKELEEVQKQFEAYRTEMGVDSTRLRDETVTAQREVSKLTTSLAKANAQIEVLTERHRMVQDQIIIQKRENDDLLTRNQKLFDQYTRMDIEVNRMSEDLLTSNQFLEQLRNECANLRAEKKIWESIQARLVEENKILAVERSHLSDLMANVQKMHNDLERSGENDRRRLESQLQLLENQAQDMRAQLSQERESVRRITLQKDLEIREQQGKIEKATQELGRTRESLVAAETSKTHLEERVEQLTRQLQGNEEKLSVYERRASGINGITSRADEDLSREQQLEAEVAELRSALKVAEVDLATARSHVQQFQDISQANEAALATLNATHDEYKAETEAELERRQSEIQALQEKLRLAEERLNEVTQQNAELQRSFDSERAAWVNEKKELEGTILDMTTSVQHTQSDKSAWEAEIRQLEVRAKAAEDRYSREVVAHAEALKSLQDLKKRLSQSQTAARENRAAAETAQAKLASSEASWQQQRGALDNEIADLKTRCKDLGEQNSILHQHLESVSTHAARIKQAASSTSAEAGEVESTDDDTKLTELRSLVTYLRKEKEIIELQLELGKQENTRLKTQVDHLSQNLDETRQALSEERERAAQAAVSEEQHSQLAEKINQVAILRESNATLRSDCDKYTKRARRLEAELREVTAQLEPTKEQVRIAQAEVEAKDEQIKMLENESRRWQERNAQLLSKYDRIDPAEVQSLKDEIAQLQTQNLELKAAAEQQAIDTAAQQLKLRQLEEMNTKLKHTGQENNSRAKARFNKDALEITKLKQESTELQERVDALTKELEEVKTHSQEAAAAGASVDPALTQELEALRADKASLEKALAEERAALMVNSAQTTGLNESLEKLRAEHESLLAEKATWASTAPSAEVPVDVAAAQSQWQSERAELVKARDEAKALADTLNQQIAKANDEIRSGRLASEKFQSRIQEISKIRIAEGEELKRLRDELQKVSQQAETSTTSPESVAKHAEELRALEERLVQKHEAELKAAFEAAKASAPAPPPDTQAAIDAALTAYKETLKEEHTKALDDAVERGRKEAAARAKLKDQQLVRSQARVKELEARIQQLDPTAATAAPAVAKEAAPAKAAPTAPAVATTSTAPVSGAPAAAATGKAGLPVNLPARPTPVPRAPLRGRGGPPGATGRGGHAIRGAAAGLGRGAGGAAAAVAAVTGDAASNVAKRTREDGVDDDTAAKRQKQGEGAPVPPVALRRNRVPPPS
ncbi:transporter [Ganoderma sinense ZZ0214-1]|uniref:Transporter n=1 Tax=Ganoderma sinense ZZ0214-1 TaxID=1077348 RepID=A0A2G8RMK9_9APHY|nr:transporter [Ganoderma sinense ZZ0214-1]